MFSLTLTLSNTFLTGMPCIFCNIFKFLYKVKAYVENAVGTNQTGEEPGLIKEVDETFSVTKTSM